MTDEPNILDRTADTVPCARCCKANPPYLTFETGWPNKIRHWCLHHIPRRVRLKMWLRERFGADR